jgi:type II secretory pathway component GspD/PulD (secretin)
LQNADAEQAARALEGALPKGTMVVADTRSATVVVTGPPAMIARAREVLAGIDDRSNLTQLAIPMRYAKASDVVRAVQASLTVTPPASAFAGDSQNEVLLEGPPDFVERAREFVTQMDRPGRQVRYEVRVTDVSPSEDSNVGFLWSGASSPVGSIASSFVANSFPINVTLNALVEKKEATILARPTITSLNDVPASLLVGEQYPIVYFDARTGTQQVQFVNVGVNLNVIPTIGVDGAITTDLETDYSQVTGTSGGFPIIATRKAQSKLRVLDGQTIVVAGLFSDVDESLVQKVPFLGDIPILGEIFRNRTHSHRKDEIVFLITPHIVDDAAGAQ